jgi:hypothetical protein
VIHTSNHCETHDAGGRGMPCPWPDCSNGAPEDTFAVGDLTYRRSTNVTDGRKWYTWKLLRGKGVCVPCGGRRLNG